MLGGGGVESAKDENGNGRGREGREMQAWIGRDWWRIRRFEYIFCIDMETAEEEYSLVDSVPDRQVSYMACLLFGVCGGHETVASGVAISGLSMVNWRDAGRSKLLL